MAKKIWFIFLLLVLAIFLVSCGDKTEESTNINNSETVTVSGKATTEEAEQTNSADLSETEKQTEKASSSKTDSDTGSKAEQSVPKESKEPETAESSTQAPDNGNRIVLPDVEI